MAAPKHYALGQFLLLERCPHCSVARPTLKAVWSSGFIGGRMWSTFVCASCCQVTLARGWLGANHANQDKPHVTTQEAQQSVEFVEALGQFLFVLSARIAKGIEGASQPP